MRTEGKLLRGGKKRHHRNRLTAALLCLCLLVTLLPSTAMAAGDNAPATLIVGNTDVISGGYWTTDENNGKLSKCDDSTEPPAAWNVHYEVNTNTLTLNDATITGESDTTNLSGADIYASAFTDQPVSLTIVLQGDNKVSGAIGIYVLEEYSSTTGGATLTIANDGGSDSEPLYITINAAQQNGGGGTTVPTYIRRTLSSNGITLSGSSIHRNASLTAIEGGLHEAGSCENCDRIRTWQAEGRVIALYDVSLSRSFRGNVTVTFPVSADYEGRTLTVVHCLNDSLDTSQAVVTDGTIRVTTDSLSPFAILDDKETSDDPFIDVNSDDWFYEDVYTYIY